MTTFVLVHGGAHGAWCWAPLLPLLEAPAWALDLPGRGRRPADLRRLSCADWAGSVVRDIEGAGLSDVVLVGHSLAGVTLPRVAARIPERLARLVYVSCVVPAEGATVFDAMDDERVETAAESSEPAMAGEGLAREMFCNDLDEQQARFVLDRLVPEASGPLHEPMSFDGFDRSVPQTYVKLLRDRALTLPAQERSIEALGVADVRELDTGHTVMVSAPEQLAAILNEVVA